MRGPDGTVYQMTGVYLEVVEPERIVFTSAALDADGNPMFEVLTTVTFAEQGGKTKQIMRARVIKSTAEAAPYIKGMEAGWTQSLERLAKSLAKAWRPNKENCPAAGTTEPVRIRTKYPRIAQYGGLETERHFA